MLASPSTNPAWQTLLPPFYSCRNRPCVQSSCFCYLGPSGSDGEQMRRDLRKGIWGQESAWSAGRYSSHSLCWGEGNPVLSLTRAFHAQVTGSLLQTLSHRAVERAQLLCILQLANANFFPPPVPIVSSDKQGPSEQLKLSINNL